MIIRAIALICALLFSALWFILVRSLFNKDERGVVALLSSLAFIIGTLLVLSVRV